MTAVLVVDDDPRMLQALRLTLDARGYRVATADDGRSALVAASDQEPFRVDELLARLRAVVRRATPPSQPMVVPFGDYLIDLDARRVARRPDRDGPHANEDVEVRLTPTEWHLLDVLVRNPEKLLTYRDLLPSVGGPAPTERSHYLRQYIARLRRKLEPDPARPRHLITEPGMGYRFQP